MINAIKTAYQDFMLLTLLNVTKVLFLYVTKVKHYICSMSEVMQIKKHRKQVPSKFNTSPARLYFKNKY